MNIEQFQSMLEEKGISLSSRQLEQFEIYFETLVEWNEKMNLTAITEKEEVYLKHFFDSVTAAFYYDFSKPFSICDVGAGAGFPSIPLKICFPHLKVTIVDSLQKRINFLNHLAQKLELSDVAFCHDRAETFGKKEGVREAYDIVMARAVARLSVLSELCLPLVKVGGTFIAMKGAAANEEIENGKYALEVLGGELKEMSTFQLPFEESERNILLIEKKRKTPKKYPRKPGTPNKLPIEK
ncbi:MULTISPECIES: 16S rRNA (guanine(527)-N(7))-methyltransferase RsmG [Bacillus]|jgi:16S rRNA (guanine527-N7)-methyltransferase|uniref:Ribosomal RNA small subunit methyltransferase G n=5 Tax=Bacillus cereus group TaxID=86661 RepID=A0A0D6T4P8_BACMY|nr:MULTISPECIES: 16S rRNA (guanine(527)-N(7))-methyltransferase RsmG [Bacillus cereus group]EJQ45531.1 ribosomal RNA small subunit methyltransferase G [Bacillus cereus BAG6X1-2]EJP86208.1 ribosomal RNA small subunit methyltransferase G [Bacillus cereus VD142]EJQ86941.1 ribosomal RNA small subunit methyltransferase G [Bacillus cereus HuA4-10]EJR00781.1 ribosomal RNA small subunit methyltransferase G [Bacillus cereus MC67]EJV63526.1 ribosomal RNA small subunit methyltransferase G [Bacillus cereu